jgi:hypothetical protein
MVMVRTWTGRPGEGRALCEEALAVLERIGAGDFSRAMLLLTAAASGVMSADIDYARAQAVEALDIARRGAMPSELAAALWAASLTMVRDQPERALELAGEAVSTIRNGASDAVLGHVLAIRAQLRALAGDRSAALADLRESSTVSQAKGDKVMLMAGFDRAIVVLGHLEQSEPVAVLAGACSDNGPLAAVSTLPRMERDDRASYIEAARSRISEAAYRQAVATGASMSADAVARYVTGIIDQLGSAAAAAS